MGLGERARTSPGKAENYLEESRQAVLRRVKFVHMVSN